MTFVLNTMTFIYFAAFALSLGAGVFAWRRRAATGGRWLALMLFAAAEWNGALIFETSVRELKPQIFFSQLTYIGASTVGVFFLLFALEFTEKRQWVRPGTVAALLVISCLSVIAAFTNGYHHLVWTGFLEPTAAGRTDYIYLHGPAYWILAVYVLLITALGTILLAEYSVRSRGIFRTQSLAIIVAAVIPWAGYVIRALGPDDRMSLDPGAYLAVTGSILAFTMLRYHLLDVVPVAKELLFAELPDGVLVLDTPGRVVDVNPAFEGFLGRSVAVGSQAVMALTPWSDLLSVATAPAGEPAEAELVAPSGATVHVASLPLRETVRSSRNGTPPRVIGRLIVARDVTAYRLAAEEVRRLNEDLEEIVAMRTQSLSHALERLSAMSHEMSVTEDRERKRLAEALHDRVSQSLSVAHIRVTTALKKGACEPEELEAIEAMLADAIRESRAITSEIAPSVLYELGLAWAFEALAEQMEQRHGLLVVITRKDPTDLPADARMALLRAARELLMNVVKHGKTDCAWISLTNAGGDVTLTVKDEGIGLGEQAGHDGFGLLSIKQRITHLGGELTLTSDPGDGVTATVTVPAQMTTIETTTIDTREA
jgi:signal transduction histidine kinase